MSETKELLQRAREEFTPPADFMGSLNARRERRRRGQRVSAAVVAIVIAFVSFAALTGAFRGAGPASQPKPPGIFSEVGGWITYGDADGIWAVDPSHPRDLGSRVQAELQRWDPALVVERRVGTPHRAGVVAPFATSTS